MNKFLYQTSAKCQHISSPTPIISVNNSTNALATRDSALATRDISIHANTLTLHANTLCKCIAIKGHVYCRHHIAQHPDDYQRFIVEQGATRKRKYHFIDADIRNAYVEKLSTGAKLYDLREDIALLTLLLERLINSKDINFNNKDILRIIDTQRKCINTMNDIRKANIKSFTQDKLDTLLTRITDIINAHIEQPDIKRSIAIKFIEVGKEYAEPSE